MVCKYISISSFSCSETGRNQGYPFLLLTFVVNIKNVTGEFFFSTGYNRLIRKFNRST